MYLYWLLIFRLLRGTFYILMKQPGLAMDDLSQLIEDAECPVRVKVNALIKRASLYIQQAKDPKKDPELSFADFALAVEIDPENADVYHHRQDLNIRPDLIFLVKFLSMNSMTRNESLGTWWC